MKINRFWGHVPIVLFLGSLFLFGCATYQANVTESRKMIEQGNYETALTKLKPLADKKSDDQLVYLLDYATALHVAGNYKESNDYFFTALKLIDQSDYQSVSRVTGSLLLNEEMVQYKGDTFEKIFVNAFLALNFLELDQLDSALVEAKRINEKYLFYRKEEKKSFELNAFAKYLSALIWEASGQWDDAFIAYNDAYKIDNEINGIEMDLLRTSQRARRMDEFNRLKSTLGVSGDLKDNLDPKLSDLVVIFQRGWGPRKNFDPQNPRYPVLRPVESDFQNALISLEDINGKLVIENVATRPIYSVDQAAIKTLKDDYASLVGRRVGGFVAKEVAADQIRQKDELLGFIAAVAMHASDRADLRQWSYLPKEFQVARIRIKPGQYKLRIKGHGDWSKGQNQDYIRNVDLRLGKTQFVTRRFF